LCQLTFLKWTSTQYGYSKHVIVPNTGSTVHFSFTKSSNIYKTLYWQKFWAFYKDFTPLMKTYSPLLSQCETSP
jgi:hypothetical protein